MVVKLYFVGQLYLFLNSFIAALFLASPNHNQDHARSANLEVNVNGRVITVDFYNKYIIIFSLYCINILFYFRKLPN